VTANGAGAQGGDVMANDDHARVTVLVRGRVQGVGFRQFAVTRARVHGLTGYARNLPEGGAVEVVAEGPRAALDALVDALWSGPVAARVEGVQPTWGPASGGLGPFDVRY